jgi:hypothetical protein
MSMGKTCSTSELKKYKIFCLNKKLALHKMQWILIISVIILILIVFYNTFSKKTITNGSIFQNELVLTNNTSTLFEVMSIDSTGNFNVMIDINGNPLLVTPKSNVNVCISSPLQLIYVNPNTKMLNGMIMSNINGVVYNAYWGNANSSDWIITSSNLIPSLSVSSPVMETNPVLMVSQPFIPMYTLLQDQSIFPTTLIILNYNIHPVTFKIYSEKEPMIFPSVSPNAFVTISTVSSYTTIIAFADGGGIQGTVLHNINNKVCFTYLFGQHPLPAQQSIGLFTM